MSRTTIFSREPEDFNYWWDYREDALKILSQVEVNDDDGKVRLATATALVGILDTLGNILDAITVDDEDDSPNAGIGVLRLGDSES